MGGSCCTCKPYAAFYWNFLLQNFLKMDKTEISQWQNPGKLLDQHVRQNQDLHWNQTILKMVYRSSNLFWRKKLKKSHLSETFTAWHTTLTSKRRIYDLSPSSPGRRMWRRKASLPSEIAGKHWLHDNENQEPLIWALEIWQNKAYRKRLTIKSEVSPGDDMGMGGTGMFLHFSDN